MAGLPAAFALDPRALSLTEGVRASLATCVVVLAASWLSQPVLLSAALAAWLTCLADAGGPLRRRIPILVGFVLLGAFFTGALGVLRGSPLPLTILLASACVFCTSFARVWGQPALQAG
ncbi:MAG: FUSC family protein, partial [Acetobacteraceae bacterium]|nr:FUSC family protein [Acetobacteraceae bacterium]